MKKGFVRAAALLLTLALCVGLAPALPAFAAEVGEAGESQPLLSEGSLVSTGGEYDGMLCMKIGVEYCPLCL